MSNVTVKEAKNPPQKRVLGYITKVGTLYVRNSQGGTFYPVGFNGGLSEPPPNDAKQIFYEGDEVTLTFTE